MYSGGLLYPLAPKHGALVSQDIRCILQEGLFGIPYSQDKIEQIIQPASLDTLTEGRCYFLRPGFRHEVGLTVMESVRLSHRRMPREYEMQKEGFFAHKDFTWLIPLKGDFFLPEGYSMISSPKSTQGRLGNRVRLIADYQPCYDLVKGPWKGKLYVLFEPQCWSNIIYEDLSLNQLRFFCGDDNRITDSEIARRWHKEGFLKDRDNNSLKLDNPYLIHEGILMTLDLLGESSAGIAALTALPNPDAVDQRGKHDWQEYLDPRKASSEGKLEVQSNLTILNTLHRHHVPPDLCAEMTVYSGEVGDIKLHEAGFFDPGFDGHGVKEVWSKERYRHTFVHNQNAGRLVYFRCRDIPDKVYGDEIGSNYHRQVGPRPAKQFGKLCITDFKEIASRLDKTIEDVMVLPRSSLGLEKDSRSYFQGFRRVEPSSLESLLDGKSEFKKRGDVEFSPSFKQPIPYVVLLDPDDGTIFAYQRSVDDKVIGEKRLQGKWSVGIGGHVRPKDGNPGMRALVSARDREISEEIVHGDLSCVYVGCVNDDRDSVGLVHYAVVYVALTPKGSILPRDPAVRSGDFFRPDDLAAEVSKRDGRIEGWTEIILDAIKKGWIKNS